jgi:N-acetyl-anhydromuramyl-L-alanine amidase AmpD
VRCVVVAFVLVGCSAPTHAREEAVVSSPSSAVFDAGGAQRDIVDAGATVDIADAVNVDIVDAPIAGSAERERLTLEYRRRHSDPEARDLTIEPRVIVLHFTGGNSAKSTRNYFDATRIEASRKQLARGGAVNVSAHFVVDRDGTIYQLQPVTRFARHCIGLNHIAIGIENVGDGAKYPLTDAQVAADAALVRKLAGEHAITHLLGHSEVMRFRKHPYFVEREAGYRNEKDDPGDAFMSAVRAQLVDLKLAGLGD